MAQVERQKNTRARCPLSIFHEIKKSTFWSCFHLVQGLSLIDLGSPARLSTPILCSHIFHKIIVQCVTLSKSTAKQNSISRNQV